MESKTNTEHTSAAANTEHASATANTEHASATANSDTEEYFGRDHEDEFEREFERAIDEFSQIEYKNNEKEILAIRDLMEKLKTTISNVICIEIQMYGKDEEGGNQTFSCTIYYGDHDMKHIGTEYCTHRDMNIFLHMMLPIIRYRKITKVCDIDDIDCDQIKEYTSNREYLFLFGHLENLDDCDNIDYFVKNLDKKSWELFGNVNFYGDRAPQEMSHSIRHIRKQFKIETGMIFPYYDSELKANGYYREESYMTIINSRFDDDCVDHDRKKACLWQASDPSMGFFNMFVLEYETILNPRIPNFYGFWKLITYGLASKLIHDGKLDGKNRLNSIASQWDNFLTKGLYDPRILLLVGDFMYNNKQ
jgi:hypothetical protein